MIGGGPAGLQAALTLGRMHRRRCCSTRAATATTRPPHMHNFLTHDGTPPAELRAAARKELAAYDTGEHAVRGRDRRPAADRRRVPRRARRRGRSPPAASSSRPALRDTLPDKPGLAELFGTVAAHCPFCHGHEFAGRHVAILGAGPRVAHLVGLVGPIASRMTVLADGEDAAEVPPGSPSAPSRSPPSTPRPGRAGDLRRPAPTRRSAGSSSRPSSARPRPSPSSSAWPCCRRAASRWTRWAAPACPACTPPATWRTSRRCRCRWRRCSPRPRRVRSRPRPWRRT